jgi:hypothetical protein
MMKPFAARRLFLATLAAAAAAPGAASAAGYGDLQKLWKEWRAFAPPAVENCAPDYGAAAMEKKAAGLAAFQKRLAAIDPASWTPMRKGDYRIVAAEMNGLDFDLRVLKPFARDPSFYATVFGEESDVPEHEGPSAHPPIDLYAYEYPLSKSDQKKLTCLLGAVPEILEDAKVNLKDSNARDLWVYGTRAFREQAATLDAFAKGELSMRTLEGAVKGDLAGASPELMKAVADARAASEEFRLWIETQAPSKTGPSGVGVENYDWYMANVQLVAYDWKTQVDHLRRELERSRASLALEEFTNRDLPAQSPVNDEAAYMTMAKAKMDALTEFLIGAGIVADKDYYREALANEIGRYAPPESRNFFGHGVALDPTPLYTHFYHWIELAMRKHEPVKSRIRAATPIFDMYADRSEGMATAAEELLMHAGLYDDSPRSREIVWIMLANRAARGLASLYVQANEMTLDEAGKFHARWTPRKWSDPSSDLVAFEQLLYLRQPGYGASYVTGKLELDRLISDYAFDQEQRGEAFGLPDFFRKLNESGISAFPVIEADMTTSPMDGEGEQLGE